MTKPTILISNDDGVRSEGIIALTKVMIPLGRVIVVAPAVDQSTVSHAMSLYKPLRLHKLDDLVTHDGHAEFYSVDGTPTDCVYMAINHILKDEKPDLMVSGINHGGNLGNDILYSGTVSAAMEAAFFGVPAIAFSSVANHSYNFGSAQKIAVDLAKNVLKRPLPPGTLLNVNIPKKILDNKAMVTTVGRHGYKNDVEVREDPRRKLYYWIGGKWNGYEDIAGSDCKAIHEGHISISPIEIEMTAHKLLPYANELSLESFDLVAHAHHAK